MNSSAVTVALVGCGRIGQTHLEVIARDSRVRLVGVADIVPEAARSAGEAGRVPSFTDMGKLLHAVHPEAIILCTPPSTHPSLAAAALGEGCHLLCEKPLAVSVALAEEMISAAERASRVLMMASKFRYVPSVIKAKALINGGGIGVPVLLENSFCERVEMGGRWNSRREISGGGVLIDNGSHSVDIARYLAGPLRAVSARFGKNVQALAVEDTCHLAAVCDTRTLVSIDLSWSISKSVPWFLRVSGTEGTLEVGWKEASYQQYGSPQPVPLGKRYDKFEALGAQLANFVGTIAGSEPPLIINEDALESVRVIETAYRSAEHDRWEVIL